MRFLLCGFPHNIPHLNWKNSPNDLLCGFPHNETPLLLCGFPHPYTSLYVLSHRSSFSIAVQHNPTLNHNEDTITTKRRKIKTTLTISTVNGDFIRERIAPNNDVRGFTGGLSLCVNAALKHLDGIIPEIPQRENKDSNDLQTVDATFQPDTMDALGQIIDHWKNTNRECSRSAIVDYFLTEIRHISEKEDQQREEAETTEQDARK